jgi:ATP-dependent protease ClpP protease subunit
MRQSAPQRNESVRNCHEYGIIIDTREIFLTDAIDVPKDEQYLDNWTANNLIRNIRLLLSISNDPILIHMISCGGDWGYGIAIYDALKFCPAHTTILAYAFADSMSSVIAQAADTRVIMPTAEFLIHWVETHLDGSTSSVMAQIEQVKKYSETMLDIYISRCYTAKCWKNKKMGKESVKNYMRKMIDLKQDVYLTPQKTVEFGLMDAVLGDKGYENIEVLKGKK